MGIKLTDDEMKHRSRSKKKAPKKSDHKHDYQLANAKYWLGNLYMVTEVCSVCGKERTEIKLGKEN